MWHANENGCIAGWRWLGWLGYVYHRAVWSLRNTVAMRMNEGLSPFVMISKPHHSLPTGFSPLKCAFASTAPSLLRLSMQSRASQWPQCSAGPYMRLHPCNFICNWLTRRPMLQMMPMSMKSQAPTTRTLSCSMFFQSRLHNSCLSCCEQPQA